MVIRILAEESGIGEKYKNAKQEWKAAGHVPGAAGCGQKGIKPEMPRCAAEMDNAPHIRTVQLLGHPSRKPRPSSRWFPRFLGLLPPSFLPSRPKRIRYALFLPSVYSRRLGLPIFPDMAFTFGGKYKLEEEIAMGGCGASLSIPRSSRPGSSGHLSASCVGTVFQGVHTIAGKEVAIKLEPAIAKSSPLKQESKIYKTLMGAPGVPWINWSANKATTTSWLSTSSTILLLTDQLSTQLAITLESVPVRVDSVRLLTSCSRSRHTQITRIECIHSRDLVHRDIKPANFVIPKSDQKFIVNIIDFGLAKKFREPRTGPSRTSKTIITA
ncbi:Casein kinase I [Grifola frondosa]|uniref:non-specific serine/threonine protein kinase n=1 Tax=Grifola frondosa TaxID=5627 RepID=A0A1C7MDX1_GRIFR|nr:Casein kinase I [Grifola frondosa]